MTLSFNKQTKKQPNLSLVGVDVKLRERSHRNT